ncbi:hypothetical protein [Vagococcus silagei]|uniref:Alternate signal-mediated exported protein, CPF_0494 family n=1 Tax=Vagococcus silagei TaxID=2508885 RepID=A0A4S3B7I9_9ENTE|nr:hypothetical protein [Vagococcus silagei]THB60695.1 hypothetical protein ESZ54_08875 [Vagococcus silagei]
MKSILKKIDSHKSLVFSSVLIFSTFLVLMSILKVTLADETSHQTKSNDFTVGNLETKIYEEFEKPIGLSFDKNYKKVVKVKNDGNVTQFIRVMILPELTGTTSKLEHPQTLSSKIGSDLFLLDQKGQSIQDTSNWIDGKDGYFYYTKALDKGKETVPLFEMVKLNNSIKQQFPEGTIKLQIAVKVEGIITLEDAYQKAWWQGKKPQATPLSTIDGLLVDQINMKKP